MIAGLGVISARVFIMALAPVSVRHNSRLFSLIPPRSPSHTQPSLLHLPSLHFTHESMSAPCYGSSPTVSPFRSLLRLPPHPTQLGPFPLLPRLLSSVCMNTHQLSLSFNLIRHPSPRLPRYITYPGQECWVGRNQRPRIHEAPYSAVASPLLHAYCLPARRVT